MSERNPDECGALWLKDSAKGKFMSGQIDGVGAVVVFKNTRKQPGDKQPDYRVLKARPKSERE